MALYISAGRRLRRTVIIAAVTSLLAFGLGWLVGRQQVPSIDDRVDEVQTAADDAATGLERLDIEYEQVLAGSDDLDTGVLVPLDNLRTQLQTTLDRAPWLGSQTRAGVLDSVASARQSAVGGDTLEKFKTRIDAAANQVRAAFDIKKAD